MYQLDNFAQCELALEKVAMSALLLPQSNDLLLNPKSENMSTTRYLIFSCEFHSVGFLGSSAYLVE